MSKDKAIKPDATHAIKRAVLYARTSGDDRSKDNRNLKSQLEMCRDYAIERGYTIMAELHEDDRGACGASFELPQLGMILTMAERKEFDVLVVRELDRLSRNLAKQLIVEETLKGYSVQIEYVLADYDDSPEGNLQKHVRATIAEYEREKIRERSVRGRRNKVKSGKILLHGDHPPYGYRVSDDKTTLIVYELEAEIIRNIFQWYVVGDESGERLSMKGIAQKLTGLSVPTWSDIHGVTLNRRRDAGVWIHAVVSNIIHDTVYKGIWFYGKRNSRKGIINPDEHRIELRVPSIIDAQMWEGAQARCQENFKGARRNVTHEYLMRFRLTCMCGYSVVALAIHKKSKVYLYYTCDSRCGGSELVRGNCGTPSFRADHVDALIWHWLKEWFRDPNDLRRKLEAYKADRERANTPVLALLNSNENLLLRNKAKLKRLLDLYLDDDSDDDDAAKEAYTARKVQLKETIKKLEEEKAKLVAQLGPISLGDNEIEELVNFARKLELAISEADIDFGARRRIIELLDVRGMIAVEDGEKVVYPSFVLSAPGKARLVLSSCIPYHVW